MTHLTLIGMTYPGSVSAPPALTQLRLALTPLGPVTPSLSSPAPSTSQAAELPFLVSSLSVLLSLTPRLSSMFSPTRPEMWKSISSSFSEFLGISKLFGNARAINLDVIKKCQAELEI